MSETCMPDWYGCYGTPLYWRNEQSGVLPTAILSYIGYMAGLERGISPADLELVIQYCRYYIAAPCWRESAKIGGEAGIAAMQQLINQAQALQTAQDIAAWIRECLEIGLDPL